MKEDIKITGVEDLKNVMREMKAQFPEKVAVSGIRSALGIFRKNLSRAYSAEQSGLASGMAKAITVSSKKVRNERVISAGVSSKKVPQKRINGFDKRRGVSSGYMPGYIVAYWHNYGTLQGRMPGHKFKTQAGENSKNPGGIRYSGIVEETWKACQSQVLTEIPKRCEKALERMLKKQQLKQQQK